MERARLLTQLESIIDRVKKSSYPTLTFSVCKQCQIFADSKRQIGDKTYYRLCMPAILETVDLTETSTTYAIEL